MDTSSENVTASSPQVSLKERLGRRLLTRFNARQRLGTSFKRVPVSLHRTANQLSIGLELLEDFRAGRYRSIPWSAVAILTGALLYSVSPGDIIPDPILGLGLLDDAVVLAIAVRLVRREIEAYCKFKGYSLDDLDSRGEDAKTRPPVRLVADTEAAGPVSVRRPLLNVV